MMRLLSLLTVVCTPFFATAQLSNRNAAINGTFSTASALSFDGVDDYVNMGNLSSTQFWGAQPYTIEAWIKPTAAVDGAIAGMFNGSVSASWMFSLLSTGALESYRNNGPWAVTTAAATVPLNTWTHVSTTYDGSTLSIYVNGQLSVSGPFTSTQPGTTAPLLIGALLSSNAPTAFFQGVMDQVEIWSKCLTPAEINQYMNCAPIGSETGLVGYWGFNEGSGTTAGDLTSNGNNGSLLNGPTWTNDTPPVCCNSGITLNPGTQSTTAGANVQFMAAANDANATFQWQTDVGSGFVNLTNAGQYSGATNDTLTVINVTGSNNNQPFRCIVSSGSCKDTSSTALILVCSSAISGSAPSQTVAVGSNVQFITGISGSGGTLQWQSDIGFGFQNLANSGQYSGVTNDTLNVANVTLSNNNQLFRCLLQNSGCSDTSAVTTLNVLNGLGISENVGVRLNAYPNPASNYISIEVPESCLQKKFMIYDNSGLVVKTGTIAARKSNLNIAELFPGIYLLQIDGAGTSRFMIVR